MHSILTHFNRLCSSLSNLEGEGEINEKSAKSAQKALKYLQITAEDQLVFAGWSNWRFWSCAVMSESVKRKSWCPYLSSSLSSGWSILIRFPIDRPPRPRSWPRGAGDGDREGDRDRDRERDRERERAGDPPPDLPDLLDLGLADLWKTDWHFFQYLVKRKWIRSTTYLKAFTSTASDFWVQWKSNFTEKILVSLLFLRKRSFKLCATR